MKNTFNYNGTEYTASKELQASIEALIALAKPVKATKPAQPKAETVQQTATPKAKGGQKVYYTDRYGNDWIVPKDHFSKHSAEYYAKKSEMIAAGTYDPKNRSAVYKALGWIR